jgi:O-antigen/teichoic acid export membrane protein/O-antigen ligase
MSVTDVGGPSVIMRLPAPLRVRAITAAGLGALSLLAATGVIATHLFHQPTTVKYLVTVLAPLLLSVVCLTREPLRLLVGAAIVTAPWDLNMTFQGVKVSPVTLLLAIALLVAMLAPRERGKHASPTATVVALALALLLPALAIGREQPHYLTWILTTLAAGWLALHIARQPGGLRFLLSMLVLAATVEGLIAFYEYGRHANLNLYSSEVNETVSRHYFFSFGNSFRPAGTLPDPDSLGNMLALACPLALILAVETSSRLLRLTWAACALVITVALTLTFARMSWIGAAVGVVVVLILLPGRRRLTAAAAVGSLLVVTVLIGLSVGGASLRERFESIQNPTSRLIRTAQGDHEREQIWSASLATASSQPVVGVGLGRLEEHLSENLGASHEGLHAQSVYFQFLAEAGAVGLLALLLLVGHAATGIVAGLRREPLLVAGIAGAFLAVLVGWTTDTTARYTSVSVMIAFLFAAAMAQHQQLLPGRRRPSLGNSMRDALGQVGAPPSRSRKDLGAGVTLGEPKLVLNLARSVFHLLGRYGAITLISGIGTIAIVRLLGAGGYGQYAAAVATWAVLGATADLGFSLMLSRDLPHLEGPHRPILRSAYEVATAWSSILALVMVGLAFSAGITSTRGLALLILAPSMVFNGLNPARVFFLVRHRTSLLMRLDVITTLLQVAATVTVAALDLGVDAIAAALSAGAIVNGLVVAVAANRLLEPTVERRVGRRALVRRSVPLGLLAIMTKVYLMIDLVLLGWLVSGSRLGDYAAASKLLTVLATVAGVVVAGALPAISSLVGRADDLEVLIGRIWTWLAVGAVPIFVAVALFSPTIVEVLLGHGYGQAVPLLRILSLAGALSVVNNLLGALMIAFHKTRALVIQNAAAIILNVVGNLILVPKVGVAASAWLTAGCEVLVMLAALAVIRREVNLRACVAGSARPAAAVAVAATVALVLGRSTILTAAAFCAAFVAMVAVLRAWPADFRPAALAADLRRAD